MMVTQEEAATIRAHNRLAHNIGAPTYDRKQPYLAPSAAAELDREVQSLCRLSESRWPRVLDLGCGTGFLTLAFARRGCEVTAVDISSGMLAELQKKVRARGSLVDPARIRFVERDVDEFVEQADDHYDIIVIHSALHHFPDYLQTLRAACRIVSPGGFLWTSMDPLNRATLSPWHRWMTRASDVEEGVKALLYRVHYCWERLQANSMADVARKAYRMWFGGRTGVAAAGSPKPAIAWVEYHGVRGGVDERAVLRLLSAEGLKLLRFETFALYRHAWLTFLANVLHFPNCFRILAQRPPAVLAGACLPDRQGRQIFGDRPSFAAIPHEPD